MKLVACTLKVVPGVGDLIVGISAQVIGEEAHGLLMGNKLSGKRQELALSGSKYFATAAQEALGEAINDSLIHSNTVEVGFILGGSRGGTAHQVTEVVQDTARHDRVEVDHAGGLAGPGAEQDIIELGIVVSDALRY